MPKRLPELPIRLPELQIQLPELSIRLPELPIKFPEFPIWLLESPMILPESLILLIMFPNGSLTSRHPTTFRISNLSLLLIWFLDPKIRILKSQTWVFHLWAAAQIGDKVL